MIYILLLYSDADNDRQFPATVVVINIIIIYLLRL